MSMEDTENGHRRFLRESQGMPSLRIGDYLPNIQLKKLRDKQTMLLYTYITDHLVVVLLSETCDLCYDALNGLQEFIQKEPDVNVVILFEGRVEHIQLIESSLPQLNVFQVTREQLNEDLRTRGVPWGHCLNAEGQVLTSDVVKHVAHFNELMKPFSKRIG
ncbi:hypothetical protein MM221_03635 [Salipaludibacillus sp. LMS25]|uniref:hypothetical protein n=1 Tax=Salipaludibacillus sp. LMS25 TaxID=2924031 RepID=UPI0020D009BE|nr:hypothetical protein [Salipaludibacillus sp. LMS25]UTR15691.1 hypothetical protein MM221_03635 [Salipaludibacillus sp. LMS25]